MGLGDDVDVLEAVAQEGRAGPGAPADQLGGRDPGALDHAREELGYVLSTAFWIDSWPGLALPVPDVPPGEGAVASVPQE